MENLIYSFKLKDNSGGIYLNKNLISEITQLESGDGALIVMNNANRI
jgi:hypothetical protein